MWVQKVPGGGVASVAFAQDGRTLYAYDTGGGINAWDVTTRIRRELTWVEPTGEDGWGRRLLVSREGRFLVALYPRRSVVWDLEAGRRHGNLRTARATDARLLPGPDVRLVFPSADGRGFGGWDVVRWNNAEVFGGWNPTEAVRCFDVSPDGRAVALVSARGQLTLTDWAARRELARPAMPLLSHSIRSVKFSPDGRTLALLAPELILWDVAAQEARRTGLEYGGGVMAFAFHPTAPVFASANWDGALTLFSSETGEPIRSLDFALGRYVLCAAFAPDGLTCAVGGSNRQFAVFDVDL